MLASVRSAVLEGVDGRIVTVEVHVTRGLPGYTVVGLPDAAGRESRERVRAALLSSGLEYPQQRVTVNLAPASVRKTGAGLELAVALALTCAAGGLPSGALDGVAVLGELGLDGGVRPVVGTLSLVDALVRTGIDHVIVPAANAAEAALVPGAAIRVARTLGELHACLKGEAPWPEPPDPPPIVALAPAGDEPLDLGRRTRPHPRAPRRSRSRPRARTTCLWSGRPASARRCSPGGCPRSSPRSSRAEALEVTKIHSAAGTHRGPGLRIDPPFRQPHHSASMVVARRRRLEPRPTRRGEPRAPRAPCSSTSSPSSPCTRSSRCASRSKNASCA